MLGLPVPGSTSKSSGKSGDNPNISPQKFPNIADAEALLTNYGGLAEVCCRSSSVTQITKLSDCEVKTVSEGSGKAFSSELNFN